MGSSGEASGLIYWETTGRSAACRIGMSVVRWEIRNEAGPARISDSENLSA